MLRRTEGNVSAKKLYGGIDFCKLFAAVLVVLLHSVETDNIYAVGVQYVFTRFAVPFFFITSGFFFYSGLEAARDKKGYFFRYEKKLLKLFIFYGVILYGPITVFDYIKNNPDASKIKILLLIIRRVFVIGSGAYWYFVALIISVAFLYLCYSKGWNVFWIISIILGLLLEVGYTCFQGMASQNFIWRSINNIIYYVFSWEFNFISYGIPFVGLGGLIYKHKLEISKKVAVYLFLFSSVLRVLEYGMPYFFRNSSFWQENNITIAFIPQAIAFFFIGKGLNGYPRYSKDMRQASTFIYLVHWILLYNIIDPIMKNYLGINIYTSSVIPLKFLVTLGCCMILFCILKRINNKYTNFLVGG